MSRSILFLVVTFSANIVLNGYGQKADDAVIYEPFDYPVGGLNGQSGASERGLVGTWFASGYTRLQSDSLSYSSLPVSGGAIGELGSMNRFGGSRAVSASALSDNGLLKDGATLWFSALMGLGEGGNTTNARLTFALANNRFSTDKHSYWIDNDGAQVGEGVGVFLGRVQSGRRGFVNGSAVAAKFRDVSQGKGLKGIVYGSTTNTSPAYESGEFGLVVGKIIWGTGTPDIIEIYQPGEDLVLPSSPSSTLEVDVDQTAFDTITFSWGEKVVFDEIRFGPSYGSVIDVTTASTDTSTGSDSVINRTAQTGSAAIGPSSLVIGEQLDLSSQNGVSSNFNLSVNTNYAGYQGTAQNSDEILVKTDATFNGTITAYRFWNNPTNSSIGTLVQSGGIIGDVSSADTSFVNSKIARLWVSTDPGGNAFDTDPDLTSNVGDINDHLSGSIDVSGLTVGSVYFIYGAYRCEPSLSLTMTGAGSAEDLTIDELHNGDHANNLEYYICRADFTNSAGYASIDYRFGVGKGAANLRWSGIVVTDVSARADYETWISGFSGLSGLTALADDADKDGIVNGVENYFGTDPSAVSDGLEAGESDAEAGTFTFTHPQSGNIASDLTTTYRWSSDRNTFINGGESHAGTTIDFRVLRNTPERGTTTVEGTIKGKALEQLYIDVVVSQVP